MTKCQHGMGDAAWCSICKHGVSRPETPTVKFVFTARYDGDCSACDLPVMIGQRVAKLSTNRYVHEGCVP